MVVVHRHANKFGGLGAVLPVEARKTDPDRWSKRKSPPKLKAF